MGVQKVACPECGAVLKSAKPDGWAAGTLVKCPKCQHMFSAAAPVASKPAPAKKPKAVAVVEEDDEEPDDRPAKKKGKGGKRSSAPEASVLPWVVRGVVAVGLVVAAVVVLNTVAEQKRKNAEVEKENERIAAKNAEIAAHEAEVAKPITPDQIKKAADK